MDSIGSKPDLRPRTIFLAGFFLELGLVLPAMLISWWSERVPFNFRLLFTMDALRWGLGATVPMVVLAFVLTASGVREIGPFRRIFDRLRDLLGDALVGMSVQEMVLLAAAAGIGEEVLFRGSIQTAMGRWGLEGASVLFGALHALTPAYFVLATLMGFYLGWLFKASGNLLAPILVHWIYDAVALWLLRRQIVRESPE
jgi:membrane protease YdiL (CAAX protease family)